MILRMAERLICIPERREGRTYTSQAMCASEYPELGFIRSFGAGAFGLILGCSKMAECIYKTASQFRLNIPTLGKGDAALTPVASPK